MYERMYSVEEQFVLVQVYGPDILMKLLRRDLVVHQIFGAHQAVMLNYCHFFLFLNKAEKVESTS